MRHLAFISSLQRWHAERDFKRETGGCFASRRNAERSGLIPPAALRALIRRAFETRALLVTQLRRLEPHIAQRVSALSSGSRPDGTCRQSAVSGRALEVRAQHVVCTVLRESEAALAHAQAVAQFGNWRIDLRTAQFDCSPQMRCIVGFAGAGALPLDAFLKSEHPHDSARIAAARKAARAARTSYQLERRLVHADGVIRWVDERGEYRYDDAGTAIALHGTSVDITRRKDAEERLAYATMHDTVTALPNRGGVVRKLGDLIARVAGDTSMVAVLFVNVEGWNLRDDALDFPTADEFVALAARRLVDSFGQNVTVARFGSDEFVIVLTAVRSFAELANHAQRVIEAFAFPLVTSRSEVYCTLGIGIDCCSDRRATAQSMICNANTAMLQAKAAGRNLVRFFTATMRDEAAERVALEADLRRAVSNEELFLHYQPIVAPSGRIVAYEALARWTHATRGIVPPDTFIPVAEASGLIVPLGIWILRHACRDMQRISQRVPAARLAVNISTRQLQEPDFEATVRYILAQTQMPANRLDLEITESVMMADVNAVLPVLTRLRAIGIRVSLDDFGTGYSSLAYLKRLPVDTLKIDKSFVRDMSDDGLDSAIPQAIIGLAHSLGLSVIAEGVETETQRAYLEYLGCDELQGYLFSPPVALEATLAVATQAQRPRAQRSIADHQDFPEPEGTYDYAQRA